MSENKCNICQFEAKTPGGLTSHIRAAHGGVQVVAVEPEAISKAASDDGFLPTGLGGGGETLPVPEVPVQQRPEPEKPAPPDAMGTVYLTTDNASVGPLKIDQRTTRLVKGDIIPFENTVEIGRHISQGSLRFATAKDIASYRRRTSGESSGAVTSASMAGVGLKRQ